MTHKNLEHWLVIHRLIVDTQVFVRALTQITDHAFGRSCLIWFRFPFRNPINEICSDRSVQKSHAITEMDRSKNYR